MDKLIITAACDSGAQWPGNPHYISPSKDVKPLSDEYIRAVNAGAASVHIHGVRYVEKEIQADGRRVSKIDLNGWKAMQDRILSECKPVMQFGVAAARLADRIPLMDLKPDMMSIIFTAHDEYFHNYPEIPATEMLALHPREELIQYCKETTARGIKPDIESFYTGAFFNIEHVASMGLLQEPLWTSLFFWPGGNWTPATFRSLQHFVEHLPAGLKINWNCCAMDPANYWHMLTLAIMMGGHIRVGWEDCPYLDNRVTLAETNALLVEKAVRIARELGREIASPEEAREMIGLK
jgi:Uncharacterized conserved protein